MHSPHPLVYFGQLFAMASYNGELIFIGKTDQYTLIEQSVNKVEQLHTGVNILMV